MHPINSSVLGMGRNLRTDIFTETTFSALSKLCYSCSNGYGCCLVCVCVCVACHTHSPLEIKERQRERKKKKNINSKENQAIAGLHFSPMSESSDVIHHIGSTELEIGNVSLLHSLIHSLIHSFDWLSSHQGRKGEKVVQGGIPHTSIAVATSME